MIWDKKLIPAPLALNWLYRNLNRFERYLPRLPLNMHFAHFFAKTKTIGLLLAAFALTAASRATPFDFSYTFVDGTLVTGSLDGTQNGAFVDNVSNVSLAFNGVQVTGPIFTLHYDGTDFVAGGAVVSFDATQNNFLFINSDYAGGDPFGDAFGIPSGDLAFLSSFPLLNVSDLPTNIQTWSLTAPSTNVPEAGSTLAFVAVAGLGLLGLRRRLAA